MKNKLGILVVCLFCQIAIGQNTSRKPLHGQVTNSFLAIESGNVMNINANVRTFIGSGGLFDIMARPKDTLLFTGLAFQSRKIVLTEKDCADILFLAKLDLVNNQLKEVIVHKDLKVKAVQTGNSQSIVDMEFEDDLQSSPDNKASLSDQTIKYGMNFVRIFKDIKKALKKNDEVKEEEITDIAFTAYAKDNFTADFYTKTLGLKKEEVDLFLLYCSNDPQYKNLVKPDQKFQLMDFMINKNKEFQKAEFDKK